jgi:hypothetical protein
LDIKRKKRQDIILIIPMTKSPSLKQGEITVVQNRIGLGVALDGN